MVTKPRKRAPDATLAVAYIRVSTSEQCLGLEAQRATLERFAAAQGLTIAAWHVDQGVGGATPVDERPGLLAAIRELVDRQAGVLLSAKRDRIARDVIVAATAERLVASQGARIVTADGVSADATPEAQLMRTLIDAMAAYERALIRSRTKAALAAKRAKGESIGTAPYGWSAVDGKLVPEAAEQAAIEQIRTLTAEGRSQASIAAAMELAGMPARGARWHVTTVARIQRAMRSA